MQSGLKCVLLTKIRPLVEERPALVGGKSDSHCTRVLSAACNKDGKDTETYCAGKYNSVVHKLQIKRFLLCLAGETEK